MGRAHRRQLSTPGLVAIIYYSVCGGPFGIEDTVSAAGPLLAVVGLLVMPLIWSVPEALITAELATAFPDNAGYVAWVQAAFGPFWGFMEGYLSWLSGVVDNAVYPVLFTSYLKHCWPAAEAGAEKWLCIAGFTLGLTFMNYAGLGIVGWVAVALTIFTLLPFGYIVLAGLPQMDIKNVLIVPALSEVQWSDYINVLFWNLNYWDSCSTLAGEVRDPQRAFPRALLITVVLVLLTYLPVVVVGLGLPGDDGGADWRSWKEGTLAVVAERVGGPLVKLWVVCAAFAGNFGLFASEQAENAYQLLGMAELGWLPAVFAQRSRFGTPTAALAVGVVIIFVACTLDFLSIVDLLNGLYCMAQLLEFSAFLWLRHARPDLDRPFRVPLSTGACVALLTPAICFAVVLLLMPFFTRDWPHVLCLLGAPIFGVVAYKVLGLCQSHGWLTFVRERIETLEEMLVVLANKDKDIGSETTEVTSDSSEESVSESSTDATAT